MWQLSRWQCAVLLALVSMTGGPAVVADESDWTACATADADTSVLACTRIVDAADEADGKLSIAYYSRATAHGENGDIAEAIADYTAALALDEDYANAYVGRGRALLKDGDAAEAVADFSRAIDLRPDFAEAYFNRGTARASLDEIALALDDFRAAVRIAPRSGTLREQAEARIAELEPKLAAAASSAADWAECAEGAAEHSIEACVRIIDAGMEPEERLGVAHYNLAVAYREIGDIAQAIANYGEAILLKPGYANAFVGRGLLLQKQGDHRRAADDFSKAIGFRPSFAEAYYNRGVALTALGERQKAAADFHAAIDLLPETSPLFRQARDRMAGIETAATTGTEPDTAPPRRKFSVPGGAIVELSEGELAGEPITFITLRGELKPGDEKSFKQAALAADGPVVVRLDSPGGSLLAGMEIGRTIWTNEFSTLVDDGSCASACALAWAAGRPRYATAAAEIGFHAPTRDQGENRAPDSAGSALIGGYLTELGFKSSAIVFMTESDPDDMNWLKSAKAKALGIEVSAWNP